MLIHLEPFTTIEPRSKLYIHDIFHTYVLSMDSNMFPPSTNFSSHFFQLTLAKIGLHIGNEQLQINKN